jgi:hypothetical protein
MTSRPNVSNIPTPDPQHIFRNVSPTCFNDICSGVLVAVIRWPLMICRRWTDTPTRLCAINRLGSSRLSSPPRSRNKSSHRLPSNVVDQPAFAWSKEHTQSDHCHHTLFATSPPSALSTTSTRRSSSSTCCSQISSLRSETAALSNLRVRGDVVDEEDQLAKLRPK